MDLGKYTYEQKKKLAKQKAKSKSGEVKGLRISFKISEHDRAMRLKQADEFLGEGHTVKVEMRLRGREKGRVDMAKNMLLQFIKEVPGGSEIQGTVGTAPNNISAVIARRRQQ
jgi:translation initiation factor IF-3